jgi:excisionase family DNA binding protein
VTDVLTVDQVAAHLRCGRDTVIRAIEARNLVATRERPRGPYEITSEAVVAFLIARNAYGPEQAPMTIVDLPRVYSLEEVALQTGLSLSALKTGTRGANPRFPHIRVGKRPQMTAEQAQEALRIATIGAGSTKPDPEIQAELSRRANRTRRAA